MKDNRSIMEKADLAVADLISDGGYLNPEQSNRFIRMLIDQPTILNTCRTVRMNSPKRKIEKIGFGQRVLRAAPASGTALADADRSKPDLGLIEMETDEVIAEVWIPYDVLEDNIERGGLEDTIMQILTERVSLDLEELIILGNTASGDAFLALKDGILEQVPTANVVDGSAITDIDKALFKAAIQRMPTKYLRNRAAMRHFVSHHVEMEYRDSIATRATSLGDEKVSTFTPMFAYGTPVLPVALMPGNVLYLTWPQNIIWGVQRQIMIETDRDIRRRVMIIVVTLRVDVKVEEPDATVKVEGFTDAGFSLSSTSESSTSSESV